MTVAELIQELQKLDPELSVVTEDDDGYQHIPTHILVFTDDIPRFGGRREYAVIARYNE